ncbi:MAG: aminotransferase class I and II [Chloroflexi bacterium]|nr:aminotransferase class I and II [Chloroflexota bacterium]
MLRDLRTVTATRYLTPLREGGSLPAIVEADDDGLYVLKFRGAGHGHKALIAELVAGEIGRALGLLVPEIVFIQLDPAIGRSEPDWEIQNLLKVSNGLNLGLDYLPGSLAFDPIHAPPPDARLASEIVWFDAFVTNVDRTARNNNMLIWHKRLWLIDHGAALYFQYSWPDYLERSRNPFPYIKDHVLLPLAKELEQADATLSARLSPEIIEHIVSWIPDEWLEEEEIFADRAEHRAAYAAYLTQRLAAPRPFLEEALHARVQFV